MASLGLATSQAQMLAEWQDAMTAAFPGYAPSNASLEYVHAQVLASWAADVAQLAASGSTELLRQFGLKLLGLQPQDGTQAAAVATVTAADNAGYTLPTGTQLTLTLAGAPIGFQTASTLTIPNGSTSGTVTVIAVQPGTLFNGATNPTQLVSQINWVSGVTVAAPASGGVDQETPDAYLQRLAANLQLLAPRPITATDFATMATDFTPIAGTDQQEVGRATAVDGYDPRVSVFTVSENSTNTLTVTVAPATGVVAAPGASITGTNIPVNTTVVSSTSSTIVMSNAATATTSGIFASVTGTLGNEREVTVCVTDATGLALNNDTMYGIGGSSGSIITNPSQWGLAGWLQSLREINFVVNVVPPSYTTVYVTVQVKALPGYTTSTVQAAVQSALLSYLNPMNFGLPVAAAQGWQNTQTVYRSRVEAVVQNTLGVDHLIAGSLALGTSASPSNTTTDLVLTGAFPLVTSTTVSVPLSGITVT